MPNKKISQLASLTPASTDSILVVRGGVAYQSLFSALAGGVTTVVQSTCPTSPTGTGTPGTIAYDRFYFYICVEQNLWARVPISTNWS